MLLIQQIPSNKPFTHIVALTMSTSQHNKDKLTSLMSLNLIFTTTSETLTSLITLRPKRWEPVTKALLLHLRCMCVFMSWQLRQ